MTDHVRIKDPVSGAEYTYDTAKVEALDLAEYVIDKDPMGPDGLPAPTKPWLPLGEALPGSEQDLRKQRAATQVQQDNTTTTEATDLGKDAGPTSAASTKEN